jgi:hypothetical protein
MLNIRDFADIEQMELAIKEIRRYQAAYIKANKTKGIMVKWKKGWFAVQSQSGISFYRGADFFNMTGVLERRAA